MLQQLSIDWDNVTHVKENNSHSEAILKEAMPRLNGNCKLIYEALLSGKRLTGRDMMKMGMLEYRKRIDDLKKKAGIPIKDITLKGGAKQWYL
jgi:hypothetical protein